MTDKMKAAQLMRDQGIVDGATMILRAIDGYAEIYPSYPKEPRVARHIAAILAEVGISDMYIECVRTASCKACEEVEVALLRDKVRDVKLQLQRVRKHRKASKKKDN